MAVGVDVVFVGLAQCPDAVFEHCAAVAKDERDGQAAVEVLLRHDLVAALLGKEVEPFVEPGHVDQRAVLGEQIGDRGAVDRHRTAPSGSIPNSSA